MKTPGRRPGLFTPLRRDWRCSPAVGPDCVRALEFGRLCAAGAVECGSHAPAFGREAMLPGSVTRIRCWTSIVIGASYPQ